MNSPQPVSQQIQRTISLADKRDKAEAFRSSPLADSIAPQRLGIDRLLPVHEALSPLFRSGGLRRGSVININGDRGATSLGLSLLQKPAQLGAWIALIDTPDLGILAASELGLPLGRCVSVTLDDNNNWLKAMGAVLGAFELVLTRPAAKMTPSQLRPLLARLRKDGSVLVQLPQRSHNQSYGVLGDVHLEVRRVAWKGLYSGTGRLVSRKLEVRATGKGAVAEGHSVRFWLPSDEGRLQAISNSEVSQEVRQRAVS